MWQYLMLLKMISDVPSPVDVSAIALSHHSLSITWKSSSRDLEDESSVTGYVIKYKTLADYANWEEVKINGRKNSFLLEHLRCGTKYQITVAPFNKVGKADSSSLVTAATAGSGKQNVSFPRER